MKTIRIQHSHSPMILPRLFGIRPMAYLSLIAICLATFAAPFVTAEKALFMEDFEDGNAWDKEPAHWVTKGIAGGRGSIKLENGSCVWKSTGRCDLYPLTDNIFDVSLRVQLRCNTSFSTGGTISIYTHAQPDGRGYALGINERGSELYQFSNYYPITLAKKSASELSPYRRDMNVQFDCEVTRLTGYVWPVGTEKPERPTISASGWALLTSGLVGICTRDNELTIHKFDVMLIGSSLPFKLQDEKIDEKLFNLYVPEGYLLESSPDMTFDSWVCTRGQKVANHGLKVTVSESPRFFRLRTQNIWLRPSSQKKCKET